MALRTSQHCISSRAPTAGSCIEELELDESDFVWDAETTGSPVRRDSMPTLPDWDPLRHDLVYSRRRDLTRDSMPTLPDLDPLRHDSEAPARDQSFTFRKLGR